MCKEIRVLFVCMGNICRSPTAEAVFRHYVESAGLSEHILIDSAGTHDYHIGDPPDLRTQRAAKQRGYDLSGLRGRQVEEEDFRRFDYVLAMDRENYANLLAVCPAGLEHKIRLFMEFAPNRPEKEVPDPYFGGVSGFDRVLDMIEEAARGLLEDIRRQRLK